MKMLGLLLIMLMFTFLWIGISSFPQMGDDDEEDLDSSPEVGSGWMYPGTGVGVDTEPDVSTTRIEFHILFF
jgi:hypothetical protein